jgi:molecular chaperone GrpE
LMPTVIRRQDILAKKKHIVEEQEAAAINEAGEETASAAEDPTPDAADDFAARLAEAEALGSKNWDLYLRSQAELDNYRKRAQRERQDLLKFGNENILRELLPVIDNLDRAVQHAREVEGENQGLLEGVEMTLGQFQRVLEKFQVVPFHSLGETFDPARHEAVGQLETGDYPPNAVAQELQKGYLLHERLLRPAMVMIAKAPAAGEETETKPDQANKEA